MMFIRLGLLTQYVPHVIGRIESPLTVEAFINLHLTKH